MTLSAAARRLAVLAAMLLPFAAVEAAAQSRCSAQISNLGRIQRADAYDPFGGAAIPEYHRFDVRHSGGPSCPIAVTISMGESGQRHMELGGVLLDYELFKDASLSTPVSDQNGSPSGWLTATLAGGATIGMEIFSVVPAGQIVPGGRYDDVVVVDVWQLEGGIPGRRLASRQASVRTDVVASVQTSVSIDGAERPLAGGTVGTLDFGTLESGSSRGFQLSVQGNTDYQVTLVSENRGRLTGPAGSIPYSLSLDGRGVALGSGTTLSYTNARARTHSVVVSIGDIGRAIAGTYQDNLQLTVTAR